MELTVGKQLLELTVGKQLLFATYAITSRSYDNFKSFYSKGISE
jgi:hypothetical protein